MAYKRTTQRQAFIQPVQSAPSTGDLAMSNAVGDISTLFANFAKQSNAEDQAKFKQNEIWRAFSEAPKAFIDDGKGNLSPKYPTSLIEYAKSFSSEPSAQNAIFKLVQGNITSSISNSLKTKANTLLNTHGLNKTKALGDLQTYYQGLESVWKDSPSILSIVKSDYNRYRAELGSTIDTNVSNKAFEDNIVETSENISIKAEQLANLAFNNLTPKNNKDAAKLSEEISNHFKLLAENPKAKSDAIKKLQGALVKNVAESYYRGVAERAYFDAEKNNTDGISGLEAMYTVKNNILKSIDGKTPLPFGMTKETALNAIDKAISDQHKRNNNNYTLDVRDDNNVVGIFLDKIQLATNEENLLTLKKEIQSYTFKHSGNMGKLLQSINSKTNQLEQDETKVDAKLKANWLEDLVLIEKGLQPINKSIETMQKEVNDKTAPPPMWAKFRLAMIKRDKLISSRSLLQNETIIEKKFSGPVLEINNPDDIEETIKNMTVTFQHLNTDKVLQSQKSLMSKLPAYRAKYEKYIQHRNHMNNIKSTAINGSPLQSTEIKLLWDEWTGGEDINYDSEEGMKTLLGFVAKWKHFPASATAKFNSILQGGDRETIEKYEKVMMLGVQMMTYDESISFPAAQERLWSALKTSDSNASTAGKTRAYLQARFSDVPYEDAIELAGEKMVAGNTKIKQMAEVGILESSDKMSINGVFQNILKQAIQNDDTFITKWIKEVAGFGESNQVKNLVKYMEQFGHRDLIQSALMESGTSDLFYNMLLTEFSLPFYKTTMDDLKKATLATAIKLKGSIGFAVTKMPPKTFNLVDPSSYMDFADRLVFGDDYNVRFVKNPITFEFNKTRPKNLQSISDMPFYQADIKQIIASKFPGKSFKSGVHGIDSANFAIDNGHLFFHANKRYGNIRSYKVYGVDKDRRGFVLMNNYTPNYHLMEAKKAWNEIQDNPIKTSLGQIHANLQFIGLPVAQQALENFLENKTSRSTLLRFMDWLDSTSKSLGMEPLLYNNLDETQKAKHRRFFQNYFNLITPPNMGITGTTVGVQ